MATRPDREARGLADSIRSRPVPDSGTPGGATPYGLSARRLARSLTLSPSTLAHHVEGLEQAGLVHRAPWTVYDRRKVAVRLTETGRRAVGCFTGG